MTNEEHLQRHLEICQMVYERLVAEGKWPWPESPKSDDVDPDPSISAQLAVAAVSAADGKDIQFHRT